MNLSVVIPAFNCLPDLHTCLNSLSLLAVTQPKFYVQDDCSPDYDGRAVIHPALANVERNESNLGFAANVNRGMARTESDVVLILNQDCYGVPDWSMGWDAALLNAFLDSNVAIVGARLLRPSGVIQSAGGEFDAACQPWHRCLDYSNPHHPDVATPREVEWVTGAALAIRRSVWDELGGFDPIYGRGYFEDVELCLRAREAGYLVWYEPRCTLIHRVGSTGGNPRFAVNAQIFHDRWVSTGKVKPGMALASVRYW